MPNPYFDAVLDLMRDIHAKKAADYAADNNPYSNFEIAGEIAGVTTETVFRTLIGVKIARLMELFDKDTVPQNESVDDSVLDMTIYAALWLSYRRKEAEFEASGPHDAVGLEDMDWEKEF